MQVNHKCAQQRSCVNPDHLKLGTYKSNAKDKIKDGTTPPNQPNHQGDKHSRSKLNEQQVLLIKKYLQDGLKQTDIAQMFSVSKDTIGSINRGKIWKHLNLCTTNHKGKTKINHILFNHKLGSKHLGSKLSDNQVDMIKNFLKVGLKQRYIAKLFLVSNSTINNIHLGKSWKYIY